MGGGFGVPGRRSPARSRVVLVTCAALTLACAGEKLVVGGERSAPEPVGEDAAPDAGVAATVADVPLMEDCPPSPAERRASSGCWPTRHLGRYRGFFIGVPRYETLDGLGADFPTGAVLLELGDDGRGELTFGEGGEEGTEGEPCAGLESPRCASIGRLLPGFAYELEDIALLDPMDEPPFDPMDERPRIAGELPIGVAESLSFVVWLGQPWQAWCADSPSPKAACPSSGCADSPAAPVPGDVAGPENDRSSACRCGESGCRPSATSLRLALRMSGDGQALRGFYEPTDRGFGEALLEFKKEDEP